MMYRTGVTPQEANGFGMAQRFPSARKARALSQAGRLIYSTTAARWRCARWRAVWTEDPLRVARAALEVQVPLLAGDR
jgi:hypothetical protein